MITSSRPSLIEGKWNKRAYSIHHELGRGATGIVYLARYQGGNYALKLGTDTLSISAEVNVLQELHKKLTNSFGPSVFDVDDWQEGGQTKPFYVMNLIEGEALLLFVKKRGREWIPVLMIQLLEFLEALHQHGYAFGDLKPDNLKVSGHPPRLAWFDSGGITRLGWAIKEYTQIYDRAYWQMGNRKAEPSYDLFSLALIWLHLFIGEAPEPKEHPREELAALLFQYNDLAPYQQVIWKALTGSYPHAAAMKQDLVRIWLTNKQKGKRKVLKKNKSKNPPLSSPTPRKRSDRFINRLITIFFLSSFFIFLFALYLFSQTF